MIRTFFLTLRLGVKSLLLHKLRSGLAMSGHPDRRHGRDLAGRHGRRRQLPGPAADQGPGRQQHHRPQRQAAAAGSRPPTAARCSSEYGLLRDDLRADRLQSSQRIEQAVPMRETAQGGPRPRSHGRGPRRRLHAGVLRTEPPCAWSAAGSSSDRDGEPPDNVAVVLAPTTARKLFPLRKSDRHGHPDRLGLLRGRRPDGRTAIRRRPSAAASIRRTTTWTSTSRWRRLRWRIGDMVMTSRSGSREGEIVQLSQITVTVGEPGGGR